MGVIWGGHNRDAVGIAMATGTQGRPRASANPGLADSMPLALELGWQLKTYAEGVGAGAIGFVHSE